MFSIFSWKSSPRTEKAQTKHFRKKRRLCLLPKHLYTDGQAGHMFGAGGGGGGGSTGKSHGEPSPETHNQTAQLIKDYLTQRQLRKRPTALQNGLRPWSGTSPRKTQKAKISPWKGTQQSRQKSAQGNHDECHPSRVCSRMVQVKKIYIKGTRALWTTCAELLAKLNSDQPGTATPISRHLPTKTYIWKNKTKTSKQKPT